MKTHFHTSQKYIVPVVEVQAFLRKSWLPGRIIDWHGVACLAAVLLQALLEILVSVLTAAFVQTQEKPVVTCMESDDNAKFLQAMPSLQVFSPTWWALGPFAQTVVSGSRPVRNATPYLREQTVMGDGVAVALDWKTVDPELPADAPLVVVCHGLGGHSSTNSCNGVTEVLARRGWRVVVYNRRGHGGTSLLAATTTTTWEQQQQQQVVVVAEGGSPADSRHVTQQLNPPPPQPQQPAMSVLVKAFPHHVDLDDLRLVVAAVQCRYPAAPKILVGLSAGSNLVVRFQGECAEESPFIAAVSIANGHELTHLTKTLLRKPLTDLLLVKFLKEVLYDRFEEVQHLARAAGVAVDWSALLSATHTRQFEALLTAPLCGFKHVDDYYDANDCFRSFKDIRVPLLSLANADDPVIDADLIRHAQEAALANRHIISVATVRGGHLGWLAGTTARPWSHQVLVEFLSQAFTADSGAAAAATAARTTSNSSISSSSGGGAGGGGGGGA